MTANLESEPSRSDFDALAALFAANRLTEAEAAARQMVRTWSDHGTGWKVLGAALAAQQRMVEAMPVLQRAVALSPSDAEAHNNLGNVLRAIGRPEEAVPCHRRALEINRDDPVAHNSLGNALQEIGQLDDAARCYRCALELRPDYHVAYNNLGNSLHGLGRLDEAVLCFRRALELKPDLYEAHNNLGNVLQQLGHLDEAMRCYQSALELKPEVYELHNSLGSIRLQLGQLDEAVRCYRHALELKPDFHKAHSNLIFCLNYLSDQPATAVLEEARKYGELVAARARPYSAWLGTPDPSRRLRIGIVSGDLRNHPVSFLLESFLAEVSGERLELHAYPTTAITDATTARLKPLFVAWKTVAGIDDEQLARTIHDDAIDILIDLSGHSANNRLPAFAWKTAPVQVTWLGNASTTGVPGMDYFLGDPYVTPVGALTPFSETIWRLPETIYCFTPPEFPLALAPLPALRNGFITFGSFNNLPKMNDAVISLWAKVLRSVPGSVLLLKTRALVDASVREDTLGRFAACGIAAERLLLEASSARAEMLKAYSRVDIALDPFPHPGVTTSFEALWMGVPVLTRRGDRLMSRLGESIAHNTGLSDWIAVDDEDYVRRAVIQAADLERLSRLRAGLRARMLASPLCDAPRFARHFEDAMRAMWRSWCGKSEANALLPRVTAGLESGPSESDVDSLAVLFSANRLAEAEAAARQMVEVWPNHGTGWKALGAALASQQCIAEALAIVQRAAALLPSDAEAHNNLGIVQMDLGRLSEAQASYRRAVELNPDYFEAHNNMGSILRVIGRPDEAVRCHQRALEIKPDDATAYNRLGYVLQQLGHLDEAVRCYRSVVELKPDLYDAHHNLGAALRSLGRFVEAEATCRRALELNPDSPEAYFHLANALLALGRASEAESSFRRALELKPDFPMAYRNLGNLLKELGRLSEAEPNLRRALELNPENASVWQSLSTIMGHQSDFTEVKELSDTALRMLSRNEQDRDAVWENRLYILSYHPDLPVEEIFAEFVRWGDLQDCSAASTHHDNERNPQRRMRVGFVSPDFRHHTSRFYFEPMFTHHNRECVELFAYSNVRSPDAYTERFKKLFDHWRDIGPLSDDAAARLVRQDGIDILVDGCNHMRDERLGLFARKPAPVQVTWLGSAWTSGLPTMDYVLFDPYLAPAGTLAREAIVRLPHTFVPFRPRDDFDPTGQAPCVANGYVTFGYFGRTERLNHRVFRAWGRILAMLPEARLILDFRGFGDPTTRDYYLGFLARHGVDIARVTLRHSPEVSTALQEVDIMFDSFPHCGGTMSYDAVCMGVPLLTLAGRPPLGRIGAGIMNNLGLGDWVATDEASYVEKAVAFGRDMKGLAELRRGMGERVAASAWRDEAGYARDVERAYREMWRRWCIGEAASPFDVVPDGVVKARETDQRGLQRVKFDGASER